MQQNVQKTTTAPGEADTIAEIKEMTKAQLVDLQKTAG